MSLNGYQIIVGNNGLVLEGTTDGRVIMNKRFYGDSYWQQWYCQDIGNGCYTIRNKRPAILNDLGKALDGLNEKDKENGMRAYLNDVINQDDYQIWMLEDDNNGNFKIIQTATNNSLDAGDATSGVYLNQPNGSDSQKWRIESPNYIQIENNNEGTGDWQLTNPPDIKAYDKNNQPFTCGDLDRNTYRCPTIEGYAWPHSVNIGDPISFFVSTTSVSYSLEIYRMGYYDGKGGRFMGQRWENLKVGGSTNPQPEPELNSGDASNWIAADLPCSSFTIPNDWASGCFVAKIKEEQTQKDSFIFFVVRDDHRKCDLLMQCSVTTYQAYNGWGSDSLYSYNNEDRSVRTWAGGKPSPIWFKRPYLPSNSPNGKYGAGAGAFFVHDKGPDASSTWDPPRDDANRYSCSAWEYNMVRWLEKKGYDVKYCTNIDTHSIPLTKDPAPKAFLSVGHDEYWSEQAYNYVKTARDKGMGLLWFSGNIVYNCITLDNIEEGYMTVTGNFKRGNNDNSNCDKDGNGVKFPKVSDPVISVTDYELVGGTFTGLDNAQETFTITQDCPAWLLDGILLKQGDTLGNNLVGYEANGHKNGENEIKPDWNNNRPENIVDILTSPNCQAMLYSCKSGATVAAMNTLQWSWGLDNFTLEIEPKERDIRYDPNVERFTQNLIAKCLE